MQQNRITVRHLLACSLGLLAPAAAQADIVHADDVIINFSLCTGNDCVNGESFGFDTVRLKENNLRLHFDDTSASASFPNNDWRIVVNDSTNGGANHFSIEDSTAARTPFRLDAGAPTNSLRIDSAGDVGFGTANPVVGLHHVDGNTPTLRLEQDGSSGFSAQTWDVAGNEANFFIRDATNGSALPFKIKPGASTETLVLSGNQHVGIGVANPAESLDIRGDAAQIHLVDTANPTGLAPHLKIESVNGHASLQLIDQTTGADGVWGISSNESLLKFYNGYNGVMAVNTSGDLFLLGSVNANFGSSQSSDYRMKTAIREIDGADLIKRIEELDVSFWQYKARVGVDHIGPMAQQFHALFGLGDDETRISPLDVGGVALAGVQHVYEENQKLRAEKEALALELHMLRQGFDELLHRVEALETRGLTAAVH